MTSRRDADTARKRILVARGGLQRVVLRSSIDGLHQGLRPVALLSSAVGASSAGSVLFGLATRIGGGTRVGRVLRFLGAAFAVGGLVRAVLARRGRGQGSTPPG